MDVVKIVLQFLQESSLTRTLQTLQDETQIALNRVDDVDRFLADVQQGKWDKVMAVIVTFKLPLALLAHLSPEGCASEAFKRTAHLLHRRRALVSWSGLLACARRSRTIRRIASSLG